PVYNRANAPSYTGLHKRVGDTPNPKKTHHRTGSKMAIFRAATNHISRGKGHNVVAAAAYRAGEKLTDTNKLNPNATTHDYTKKHGVLAKKIVLPITLSDKGFSIDRQELWSSV